MSGLNLPPLDVTPGQLLVIVRELHASNVHLSEQMTQLRMDVRDMRKAFDTASTVVRAVKWLAALGVAVIACIEGLRRLAG